MGKTVLAIAAAAMMVASGAIAQQTTSWEGSYVGGSLGYAWGGDDRLGFSDADGYIGSVGTLHDHGATIDLHGGYRWLPDASGLVLGGQLGVMLGHPGDDLRVINAGGDVTFDQQMDYAVTARAIAGKALANDTLVYGSLGLIRAGFTLSATNNADGQRLSADFDRIGYTLGLGVEKALKGGLSIYGEYEHANFGKEQVVIDGLETQATPGWDSIRLGVNYRF